MMLFSDDISMYKWSNDLDFFFSSIVFVKNVYIFKFEPDINTLTKVTQTIRLYVIVWLDSLCYRFIR